MATPEYGDEQEVKRAARYLKLYPECAYVYGWQAPPSQITGLTDSDWGGVREDPEKYERRLSFLRGPFVASLVAHVAVGIALERGGRGECP